MVVRLTKLGSCLIGAALMAGALAPLPALAQYGGGGYNGGGYSYDQPTYQPRYNNNYQRHCYYTSVRVYDEYTGRYVTRRQRVCD
jgi:hypothetical protein